MSNSKKNYFFKKGGWAKPLLLVLCVVLAVILELMILATAYVNNLLGHMNRVDPNQQQTLSPSQVEEMNRTDPDLNTIAPDVSVPNVTDVTFTPAQEDDLGQGDHIINILLIGQDRRPGEPPQRSDTMILVTFNTSQNTITLTSFMRDQYVQIPGHQPNKLNHAYQYGGMKLLNATLEENFNIRVDGNIEVDFNGFQQVIDLLGGVDISLTQAEADHLNQTAGFNLQAGMNHLNGTQALEYSRIRYIDSDYRRAERQRKVLMSLLEKYRSQSLTEMLDTLDDILPLVTTDMSNNELIGYCTRLFPLFAGSQLNTLRLPVDGTFDQGEVEVREGYSNWFQYHIDFEANQEILREIFAK